MNKIVFLEISDALVRDSAAINRIIKEVSPNTKWWTTFFDPQRLIMHIQIGMS